MSNSLASKNDKPVSKTKAPRSSPSQLKVVVRRLPYEMKEEEFVTAIVAAAAEAGMGERGGSWDLMYFTSGKMSKKRGRVTGTAYLHIDRGRGASADLSLMKLRAAVLASSALAPRTAGSGSSASPADKKQSGDSGSSSAASAAAGPVVEAAPFQKLFKQKPKKDARTGTIEKDADFRAFCAALQAPAPPLPSADVQADIRESEGKEEPKPQNALLDFLKERGAKRVRDSQRAAALGSSASTSRGSGGSRRSSSSSAGGSAGSGTTASATAAAAAAAAGAQSSAATAGKRSSSSSSSSTSTGSSSSSRPAAQPPAPSPRGAQKATTAGSGVSVMSASYRAALEAKAAAAEAAAAAAAATAAAKTKATKATTAPAKQRGPSETAKGRSSSARGSGSVGGSSSGGGGGGSSSRAGSKSGSGGAASAAPSAPRILSRAKDTSAKPSAEASGVSVQSAATAPTPSSRSGGNGSGGADGGKRGGSTGAKGRAGGGKSSSGSSRSKR